MSIRQYYKCLTTPNLTDASGVHCSSTPVLLAIIVTFTHQSCIIVHCYIKSQMRSGCIQRSLASTALEQILATTIASHSIAAEDWSQYSKGVCLCLEGLAMIQYGCHVLSGKLFLVPHYSLHSVKSYISRRGWNLLYLWGCFCSPFRGRSASNVILPLGSWELTYTRDLQQT